MSKSTPPMRWLAALLLVIGLGSIAAAQMESGDRGIAPVDSEGLLEVQGIKVDVGGSSAQDARYNGWRIAQREGFAKLWARSSGRSESAAPRLSDSTLDGLVSAVVVEEEKVGPNRYVATLGVLFDRARAAQYVGLSGNRRLSSPMLLIPVTVTGGGEFVVDRRNEWQRAWAQLRTGETPVDYVRVSGHGADPLLINAASARRRSIDWWKSVADLYGAANILVAEVKLDWSYPGGPAKGRFTARYGVDREVLGSFELSSSGDDDLARMMAEGVARMDAIYSRAFNRGDLDPDSRLIFRETPKEVEEVELFAAIPYQIQLETPTAAYLSSAVARLRSIPGVESVSESSLAIGGTTQITITYRGDLNTLRSALAQGGWGTDYQGGVLNMRAGAPNPTPQPVTEPAEQ